MGVNIDNLLNEDKLWRKKFDVIVYFVQEFFTRNIKLFQLFYRIVIFTFLGFQNPI